MERGSITKTCAWLSIGILSAALGCGQSAAPSGQQAAAKPGPDAAIREFLEAVRTGDDVKAAGMLSQKAVDETTKAEMVVAPPGSPTAKFEVGEVEFVQDGAHVASRWTDLDETGQPRTDEIVWVLRDTAEGWRIVGMATVLIEELGPTFLDFENPQETMKQLAEAEAEMQRRQAAANPAAQATSPASNDAPIGVLAPQGATATTDAAAHQAQAMGGTPETQRQ